VYVHDGSTLSIILLIPCTSSLGALRDESFHVLHSPPIESKRRSKIGLSPQISKRDLNSMWLDECALYFLRRLHWDSRFKCTPFQVQYHRRSDYSCLIG
jgi:hypothetical protein